MTTDRDRLKKQIVLEAFDVPADERAALVDERCGSDGELAREVWDLIRADQEAGRFLGGPGDTIRSGFDAEPPPDLPEGTVIGDRYTVECLLGEGGFGRVFKAMQSEPVRRHVALKVLKLGMNSTEIVQRFNDERQALAVMDHPGIASVYDGGVTEDGRPYFVMEMVDGDRITKYCDDRCLSIRDRLMLFRRVCDAIQHAHQKGVIHRDIKPANILVQTIDGEHVPKVIDFGIAKAIDPRTMEQEAFTIEGRVLGTPEYMSPEQAQPTQRDIDTRTDVYAMGALLYELLAGAPPFDGAKLRGQQLQELHRIIREETPPKLSTRLSSLRDTVGSIAASRSIEPGSLDRTLQGDLNWIVMKALEKEPDRRYETASAFGEDIQRYLENQPVSAGPPTRAYRLRKFVRRNRLGVAVTTAIAVLLVGGITTSTIGFARAKRAENLQRDIRQEMVSINSFYGRIIGGSWAYDGIGYDATVGEVLEALKPRIETAESPFVRAALSKTFGRYLALGGRLGDARIYLEYAVEQFDKPVPINEIPEIRIDHFWAARDLVLIYIGLDEPDLARAMYEKAVVLFERSPDLGDGERLSLERLRLGLVALDDPDEAIRGYEQLLTGVNEITDLNNRITVTANLHHSIGELQSDHGRFRESADSFERAIAILTEHLGETHPRVINEWNFATSVLAKLDDPDYDMLLRELDRLIPIAYEHGGLRSIAYGSFVARKGVVLLRMNEHEAAIEPLLEAQRAAQAELDASEDPSEQAGRQRSLRVRTLNLARAMILSGRAEAGLREIRPLLEVWATDDADTGLLPSLSRAYAGIAMVDCGQGADAMPLLVLARKGLANRPNRAEDLMRVDQAIERIRNRD